MEWEDCFDSSAMIQRLKQNNMRQPTSIQHQVLPVACKHKQDIIIAAQTGSGKTLCFGIPIIPDINVSEGIQALILSPTRELAE